MSETKPAQKPAQPVKPSELETVCALDLETSGLHEQNDQILEVAAIFGSIVDGKFVESKRFERVLPLTTNIEDWHPAVIAMHSKNGLLAEAIAAKKEGRFGNALVECDRELAQVAGYGKRWTLLGNSVHFDLRFVRRVFPTFASRLSHRCFDISATRLFCESLGMVTEPAEVPHRAMADVLGSIAQYEKQAAWVRDHFMHIGAVEIATGAPFDPIDPPRLGCDAVGHGAG